MATGCSCSCSSCCCRCGCCCCCPRHRRQEGVKALHQTRKGSAPTQRRKNMVENAKGCIRRLLAKVMAYSFGQTCHASRPAHVYHGLAREGFALIPFSGP